MIKKDLFFIEIFTYLLQKILLIKWAKLKFSNFAFLFCFFLYFGTGNLWGQDQFVSDHWVGGTWNPGGVTMSASAGNSKIYIGIPTSTGNRYWRLRRSSNGQEISPSSTCTNGDDKSMDANFGIQETAANSNCTNGAWYVNVASTSDRYVFKTPDATNNKFIVFRILGNVQSVSTVTQSPISSSVYSGNSVTVTATLSGAFATGQAVYLRYTTNNFSSSTVVKMTGSETTYTASIPAQVQGTNVKYYVFTSGDGTVGSTDGPSSDGSDADYRTINLNDGGSNYSYTVIATFAPTVTTPTATAITNTTATLGATVTSNGGATLTARGTSYKTSSPVVATDNQLAEGGTAVSAYSHSRTGLSPQTLYYYVGYATNSVGTAISSEGSFRTLSNPPTVGSFAWGSNTGCGNASLNWTGATFPGSGATNKNYILLRAPSGTTPTLSNGNGAAPVAGASTTIVSSSILSTATNYTDTPTSGSTYDYVLVPYTWDGTNASTYNYLTGLSSTSVTVTSSGTWLGTTSTDWATASNWCGGIPTNTTDVVIPSTATNMPTVSANAVAKSVTINSGATLNGGTENLTLSGNFTNNGTFNPDTGTITVSNTGTTFGGSTSPYTFYNLYLNKGATFSAQPTINNILNIKAGGYITGNSPIYASGSTLKYNTGGDFVISTEWTDTAIPHHVTIGDEVNNSKLNFGAITSFRLANGNVTIGTGANTANLTLSTDQGGDLKLKGNYTVAQNSSTTNNGRAVFFTGAVGNQIVTKSGGGTIYFDYLFVDKNVGDLQLSGTTGQKTNLQINSIGAANVYQLELINGSIDLNGQMFTMNATNSTGFTENTTNIKISGTGARRIYTSTGSGDFVFAGNYSAGKSNAKFNFASSATLTFDTNVTLQTSVGLDFGTNGSTLINSILQINQKGFVIGHSPDYGNYSTLIYNNGSNGFFRNMEWNSNSGAGYPNNVIVRGSNNTLVELDGGSPIGFPVPNDLGCSGNLTVESGATLKFNNMNFDLYVAGNVNLSGSLQQSAKAGADLFVNGNWVQSGTGVLAGNNRTVVFNKQSSSIAQTISGSTTFDNITLNNSAGLNCIGATDNNTVNQNLTLTNGKITLNTNNLIIGASGNITNYSDTRYIVTNNTGELKRTLGTDKYYPVGSETAYNPIKLSNNGTTDVYGIRTIYGDITDAKNLSDPNDYFDSNAVLKLKWQITEAVSGGSILTPEPEWNYIDQGSNFSACSKSVNLYNGDYTWLEADASYSPTFRKTATPSSALNPTDLSSGNHYITVGDVHDTTTYNGDANTGYWDKCLPSLKIKAVIKGTFDTSISQGTSFEAKRLTVDPGASLDIKFGNYVKVVNEVVNNGTLTVESDGNLVQINNTTNSGAITVKRNAKLKRLDYNYWGAPVAAQNVKSFSSGTLDSRFYVYNESNDYFDGLFVQNTYPNGSPSITPTENKNTYTFIAGKGYAIRASNTAPTTYTDPLTSKDWVFTGVPNNGMVDNISLAYTDATHGYNLVANPYPSNIDFDALYNENDTKIYQTAYFWTNVNPNPIMQGSNYPAQYNGVDYYNNYAVYNGSGGVAATATAVNGTVTPDQYIKVGQGFIVKAKPAGKDQRLIFNNNIRIKTNSGHFFNVRNANATSDRFWLSLTTPLGVQNDLLIAYKENATNDFELDYDAPLLTSPPDSFYSVLGTEKLMIQGRKYPLVKEDKVILGQRFYQDGSYTISIKSKEGIFANGQNIYLKDKLKSTLTNLQNSDYTFEAVAGESADRFEIVYQEEGNLAVVDFDKNELSVFKVNDGYKVISKNNMQGLEIYDASGKLIKILKQSAKEYYLDKQTYNRGVYILKIKTKDKHITRKIIF